MRIAVPERRGHDDLVMAMSFALLPSVAEAEAYRPASRVGTMVRAGGRDSPGFAVAWSDPGSDAEVRRRAAKLESYWRAGEGPVSLPDGMSVEGYALDLARKQMGLGGPANGLEGSR
jgi:hypothetical protein